MRLHVDRQVRHGLGAVHDGRDAARARGGDELGDRQHRAEGVRDVRQRDEARARAEQPQVRLEVDDAAAVDRHDADPRAGLRREQLPGHDVRVVLELRDDDLVAGARAAGGRSDCATRLIASVVPRTNTISRERGGVDEAAHLLARTLVERRSLPATACARRGARWRGARARSRRPHRSPRRAAAPRPRCRGRRGDGR